jgi:hypothetical protein
MKCKDCKKYNNFCMRKTANPFSVALFNCIPKSTHKRLNYGT